MLDQVSTFFVHNYLWLILIGAVLVMALIGYIADKKNLIKTSTKNKNNISDPVIVNNMITEPIINSEQKEQTVLAEEVPLIDEQKEEPVLEPITEDIDIASLEHIDLETENETLPIIENIKSEEIELPITDDVKTEEEGIPASTFDSMEMPVFEDVQLPEQKESTIDEPTHEKMPIVEDIPQELFQPMGHLNFDSDSQKKKKKQEMDVWQF